MSKYSSEAGVLQHHGTRVEFCSLCSLLAELCFKFSVCELEGCGWNSLLVYGISQETRQLQS